VSSQPVALITGASRGIGAATARQFAKSGYRVSLVATSTPTLKEVADQITATGGTALALAGDLADLAFGKSAVDSTVEAWGRIDVLVNNAASRELISMRRITPESWNHTLQVCLTAPAFLARWAAADMEKRGRGAIINVSSIMAEQAAGIAPAYIASKGGLDALTYELASLYGSSGIRVVSLHPGGVDTEMSRDMKREADQTDELGKFCDDMIMLGRCASTEEIARVILFLAGDDAAYITGTTVTVDGGWRHQHFPLTLKKQNFPDDYS
jgi:NAD(P)-dependent dehydrogenase (short-subunit alcohol dehydrogenase family)